MRLWGENGEDGTKVDRREGETMGRRGPKPEPTTLALAKGDRGKRAKGREGVEPRPEGLLPGPVEVEEGMIDRVNYADPPKDASGRDLLDENGRAMWIETVDACAAAAKTIGREWLTRLDRALLFVWCMNWSVLCQEAREAQESPTILAVSEAGPVLKVSPHYKAALAAMGQLKGLAAEFGFSPSARARLTLGAKWDAAAAMFDDFLAKG